MPKGDHMIIRIRKDIPDDILKKLGSVIDARGDWWFAGFKKEPGYTTLRFKRDPDSLSRIAHKFGKDSFFPNVTLGFLHACWMWDSETAENSFQKIAALLDDKDYQVGVEKVRSIFKQLKKRPGDHPDKRVRRIRRMRDILFGED